MSTTKADIKQWFEEGVKKGATHMIVKVDRFDYEDYPVYANDETEARKVAGDYSNMQGTMEVYNLKMDMQKQLDEGRSHNF